MMASLMALVIVVDGTLYHNRKSSSDDADVNYVWTFYSFQSIELCDIHKRVTNPEFC